MKELIQTYTERFEHEGESYAIHAYGEQRVGGTWEGWIEFHPMKGSGQILSTLRETTQPDRAALVYWASGLEPLYFEGALQRAVDQQNVPSP
ncbi:MAG: hypothetical protein HY645_14655 [Acidobacteria bacterium]|nr:hypothetical protein [Acidobacteriota bacterium]